MLSQKRLVYALVRDGAYDLMGQIDIGWITDPTMQMLIGAVAESLSVHGQAKLPDVINVIEASQHHRIKKDIYISTIKEIVSSPTVWTPDLPEHLLEDYRDYHKQELAKTIADDLSTVEQRLAKVESYRTALMGIQSKNGQTIYEVAEEHIQKIESGEMLLLKEKSIPLYNENLRDMFSGSRIYPVPICIGAREGFGKTTVLLNLILDFASSKRRGLFYNLEDTNETAASKWLSAQALVPYSAVLMGEVDAEQLSQLKAANNKGASKYIVTKDKMFSIDEWERDVRKECLTGKVEWIGVDFIQSFRGIGRSMSDIAVNLSRVTKIIRQLTKEFFIPIMFLSQVNENGEDDGEVMLHIGNLKGSGSIKEDCRQVFLMDGMREGEARNWRCVKNSGFGPTFKKTLTFDWPVGRIKNVSWG